MRNHGGWWGWAFGCVLLAGVLGAQEPAVPPTPPQVRLPDLAKLPRAKVAHVIDGDTLELELASGRVRCRLFGLDAPETQTRVERYGPEATRFLENLLKGEEVWVAVNAEGPSQDEFGRMLGFLFRVPDGLYVNQEIVRQGYGRVYERAAFTHRTAFLEYERRAREAGKGLWGQTDAALTPANPPAVATPRPTATPAARVVAPLSAEDPIVYVTKSGQKYHRVDCSSLSQSWTAIPLSEARRRYTPCARCKPPQ